MYDVIIIGAGIGGVTSAIYAKRSNMNILLLDKAMPGGLLNNIEKISNYPGLSNIAGPDFATNLYNQINDLQIPFKMEEVIDVDLEGEVKKVITSSNTYEAKNVILAMGRKPKYLGLDNEKDYLGKGLSTCALCDGFFYKDKPVAVVGSGNSALQESLYLAKIASKVYIINRRDGFKGEDTLVSSVLNRPNIEVIYNTNVKSLNEQDGKLESIILDNGNTLDVKGIFIYIGYKPDTDLVKKYDILNIDGYVIVDEYFETKLEGVFAIGDVIKKDIYQLVTAADDGLKVIYNIDKNR